MKYYFLVLIINICSLYYALSDISFSYSGYTNLYAINRIDDGSVIKLPFRLLSSDFNINYINFSINAKWGLEHKIKSFNTGQPFSDLAYDLVSPDNVDYKGAFREYYLSYFPSFGEIKLGKQIHAWGATDVSSPIDVLNPIDYYYLFTDTDETKIGRESVTLDIFPFDDMKIHLLVMPNHVVNNIPENDPDFPITLPASPQSYQMLEQSELNHLIEFGGYIQTSFSDMDWTLSYFSGYDRNFNLYGAKIYFSDTNESITVTDTIFSYRKTDMIGLSNVSFIGDITLRSDFSFFNTDDGDYNFDNREYQGRDPLYYEEFLAFPNTSGINQYFDFHGQYYQYSFQLEYGLPYDIDLVAQIFGYDSKDIKSNGVDINITNFEFSSSDLFFPGTGSSLATLAESGILINLKKNIWDDTMEFEFSNLFDTKDKGQLRQFKFTYNVVDNLNLSLLYYKGEGNHSKYIDNPNTPQDDSLLYPFNAMEKFSHIRAQLQYFF